MIYETLPWLHKVETSEIEHFLVHSHDLCVSVVSPLVQILSDVADVSIFLGKVQGHQHDNQEMRTNETKAKWSLFDMDITIELKTPPQKKQTVIQMFGHTAQH